MPLSAVSIAVVGMRHKNADGSDRRAEIDMCMAGENVSLVPEPENEFDPRAIAVYSQRMVQIGYVKAERASRIGSLLGTADVVAVFQRPSSFGAWVRIAFDGVPPILTDAMLDDQEGGAKMAPLLQADEFYPDAIWPDD